MKINAINNQTFKLNRTSMVRYNPNSTKTFSDIAHLENGKKIVIAKTYDKFGNLIEKLQYLKDFSGEWIKSKLQYFEEGKVIKALKGYKK